MTLPRPEHWRERWAGLVTALIFFGGFGLLCSVWTAVMLSRSDFLTMAVTSGFAIFALCFVAMIVAGRLGWSAPRGNHSEEGTVLRGGRGVSWLLYVAVASVVVSGTLFVVFVPRGEVGISMTAGQRVFFPIAMALVVLIAVAGLVAAVVRGGTGYLRLSPRGFEIADLFFTTTGSWAEVVDVTDVAPDDKRMRFPIVMNMRDGSARVISGADSYVPGGNALYWMVRHYWLRPESRVELTNGRALERLRSEQFEPA